MDNKWQRSAMLLGTDSIDKLEHSHVAVFGVGGVGSYAVEGLARCGVYNFTLFDSDCVCESNINRQLIATTKTLGVKKVQAAKERILEINPNANVTIHDCFYTPENAHEFPLDGFDFIVDAIDTVTSKLILIQRAYNQSIPIISSMGAGNKLDPTAFVVTDIYKTSVCPLARVMRRELRAKGVDNLLVVYSTEKALTPMPVEGGEVVDPSTTAITKRRQTPGSLPFVPSVAGLIIASEVSLRLCGLK